MYRNIVDLLYKNKLISINGEIEIKNNLSSYPIITLKKKDYIIEIESSKIRKQAPNAVVTFGRYNSETESFDVTVSDTLDKEIPFNFIGSMAMPIDKAQVFDRNLGATTEVEVLNFPLKTQNGNLYLSMSGIHLSRGNENFNVNGTLTTPSYSNIPEYAAWKAKSDSLMNGTLATKGLDAVYAYEGDATSASQNKDDSWTWRAWVRIASVALIAGGVSLGLYENSEANDIADKYNKNPQKYDPHRTQDKINKKRTKRNALYGVAGAGLVAGVLTFVF